MNRTEATVRAMLAAIEAPLYDIGVLSDRGMLPGLDGISAVAVLARLPLLKYRNAHGSHIYIRPSGEHRFTVLDDLAQGSLVRLSADGFEPCAFVETSPGNFQAWLKHALIFTKLLGTFAAQTLAARYDADPSAADWRRFGRLPGFTNCKPRHSRPDGLFPFVRLHGHSGEQYRKAEAFAQEITTLYQAREQERETQKQQRVLSPQTGGGTRLCRSNASALQPSTATAQPPPTSPSVSPLTVPAWMNRASNVPLKTTTSLAIPVLQDEPPKSRGP